MPVLLGLATAYTATPAALAVWFAQVNVFGEIEALVPLYGRIFSAIIAGLGAEGLGRFFDIQRYKALVALHQASLVLTKRGEPLGAFPREEDLPV